jgi:hypothetical protein
LPASFLLKAGNRLGRAAPGAQKQIDLASDARKQKHGRKFMESSAEANDIAFKSKRKGRQSKA